MLRPPLAVYASLCLLLVASQAIAQAPRPGKQRQRPGYSNNNVPKENVRFSGTIKALQGGLLQVVNEDGSQWVVKAPDRGQDSYVVGSATREWLEKGGARGLQVRFVATFDAKGNSVSAVNQLFVFTPRQWGGQRGEEYKVGVYPEGGSGQLKGAFTSEEESKPAPTVMDFRVVGQLAGVGNGAIVVAAGGAKVSAKLADDAQIAIDIGDLRYIRMGDKIQVEGWHLPGQPQQVFANRLTITAAEPLGSSSEVDEKGKDDKSEDKEEAPK